MITNFVEYAVVVLYTILLIKMNCREKTRWKSSSGYKSFRHHKNSIVVFKKPQELELQIDAEGSNPIIEPVPVKGRQIAQRSRNRRKREIEEKHIKGSFFFRQFNIQGVSKENQGKEHSQQKNDVSGKINEGNKVLDFDERNLHRQAPPNFEKYKKAFERDVEKKIRLENGFEKKQADKLRALKLKHDGSKHQNVSGVRNISKAKNPNLMKSNQKVWEKGELQKSLEKAQIPKAGINSSYLPHRDEILYELEMKLQRDKLMLKNSLKKPEFKLERQVQEPNGEI